ncbi:NAD-dependent epimerase/dehydratase family protein [Rhizobium terrae]|uniref:NAD(P)-dependent oxidoreductase n=1 Tax=Rhizobium terrae TaxID=2171756 RepID=UPI000E3D3D7F|nr:NAD(P)-dependent oxidoreductase [Rhizobium terrae]
MTSALIGHTGFVGSNLTRQTQFDALFNSSNITEMKGRSFDRIVCAGVRAVKWLANAEPEKDLAEIAALAHILETVKAKTFTLISTVDVYPKPFDVDEDTVFARDAAEAYGRNRLFFEDTVRSLFERVQIVRLPGLFGTGLKKNVIYDMLNDNRVAYINPESSFQWYDLAQLSMDLAKVEELDLPLVNFAVEPITTEEIRQRFFPEMTIGENAPPTVHYRMKTRFDKFFGGRDGFLATKEQTMDRLADFISATGKS